MRNKTAKEILKILKLVFADDEESRMLGVSLFAGCWMVTNLKKYQSFELKIGRNFSSKRYLWEQGLGLETVASFTKVSFIRFITSPKIRLSSKCDAIRAFVIKFTGRDHLDKHNEGLREFFHNYSQAYEINNSIYISHNRHYFDSSPYVIKEHMRRVQGENFISECDELNISSKTRHTMIADSLSYTLAMHKARLSYEYGKNRLKSKDKSNNMFKLFAT